MTAMDRSQYNISVGKEALFDMPMVDFDGDIAVIDTPQTALEAIRKLSTYREVGIDTETRPNFRKGQNHQVALIQLSTLTCSYLFRICKIGLMPEIIAFLENPAIMKVGLSLKDDFHNLHKLSEFHPINVIELQQFVKDFHISDASLQKIYGILFGERISKGQRLSNWEADELTEAQQRYASIDAWACLRIYDYLSSGSFRPEESPYKVYPETDVDADIPSTTEK